MLPCVTPFMKIVTHSFYDIKFQFCSLLSKALHSHATTICTILFFNGNFLCEAVLIFSHS